MQFNSHRYTRSRALKYNCSHHGAQGHETTEKNILINDEKQAMMNRPLTVMKAYMHIIIAPLRLLLRMQMTGKKARMQRMEPQLAKRATRSCDLGKMFSKNTCKVRQFLRPEAGNFKFQRLHLNLWITIRKGRWQCDLWVPRCSRWCPAARPPWRRAAGCTIWKYCSR